MKRENRRRAIGIMAIINGARINSMKLINDRLHGAYVAWIEGYCKIYSIDGMEAARSNSRTCETVFYHQSSFSTNSTERIERSMSIK